MPMMVRNLPNIKDFTVTRQKENTTGNIKVILVIAYPVLETVI